MLNVKQWRPGEQKTDKWRHIFLCSIQRKTGEEGRLFCAMQPKGVQQVLPDEVPYIYRPVNVHEKNALFPVIPSHKRRDPSVVFEPVPCR